MVPLWIVALAAGIQMQERQELSGDGDFTSENQAKIQKLRQEEQDYSKKASEDRQKIENSFEQNFRQAIATVGSRLQDIARGMDQAEQSFQAKLNGYGNDPLKGSDQTIQTAALAAQKAAQVAQQQLSKIQMTFGKEAAKTSQAWGKKEATEVKKWLKEIASRRKTILKSSQGIVKSIASVGTKSGTEIIKMEKKADKTLSGYDGKNDKIRQRLEEEVERTDDLASDMESRTDDLVDDTESVISSEDPEKPGLEVRVKEGSEEVEEVAEEAGEELDFMGKDNAEETKYAEEDTTDSFAGAAEELADLGEKYTEVIGETGAGVRKAVQRHGVANDGAQATFEKNVQTEMKRAEQLTVMVEDLENRVETYKEVMHEQLQAMTEHAVGRLEKVMEENQASFEEKAQGVYEYVTSSSGVQVLKAQSHVAKVRQSFMAEIQQASDQAEAYTNQGKATLVQAAKSLDLAMSKLAKIQASIAQQDKDKQVIPMQATQVEIAANTLLAADGKASTTVNAQAKGQSAKVDETAHEAQHKMGVAFTDTMQDINLEQEKDSKEISDVAGMSAERLDNMLDSSVAQTNSLKSDVETADYALSATQAMLTKSYKLLQAVPETFTQIGSKTTELLRDSAYDAEQWAKDSEDPLAEAIKQTMAKNEGQFDGTQNAVETAQELSAQRINKQVGELGEMIEGTRGDMSERRQVMHNRRAVLNQELAQQDGTAQAAARRMTEGLAASSQGLIEHHAGYTQNMRTQKGMFQAISDNTTATSAAIISQFQAQVGEAFGQYSQEILSTSKHADVAVLEAKKAIQAATQKDTLAFRTAAMKLTTKIEDNFALQAKLKKGTLNAAGADGVAVADESLAQVDAAQRAVASLIEKMQAGIERIAGKANDRIGAAVTAHDSDRSALSLGLKQQLSELEDEQRKSHTAFKQREDAVHTNFALAQTSMLGSIDTVNHAFVAADRKTSEAAAATSQAIGAEQAKVSNEWRNNMVQEEAWTQSHAAEAEREAMNTRAVEMQAERQASAMDKEVGRAEQAAQSHLDGLQPGEKTGKLTAEVGALSKLFGDEIRKTTKLEDEAEAAAQRLNLASSDETQAANLKLASLAPAIQKEAERGVEYFQKLEDEQNNTHLDMANALDQLIELGVDMNIAMQNKGIDLHRHLKDVEEEVGNMTAMTQFASGDALGRVIDALEVGQTESSDIVGMLENEVKPKTKDLRKRVGQIYEDAGMSLDLDRVAEMGNSTMAEEVSNRQRLVAARAAIEENMHQAAKATQGALNSVYLKTKHLLDQVGKMNHLSEAEKEHKIREIKAAAARQTAEIMAKARSDVQQQMKASHRMDEQEQEIAVLVARAKSLSSGEFQTTDKASLAKLLTETKAKVQAVRDKWVNPFAGDEESLLQEGDKSKWTPGSELSQDLVTAQNLQAHRDDEDAALEQQLEQLRIVA